MISLHLPRYHRVDTVANGVVVVVSIMSSSFEKAIEAWSEIGLASLQKQLDDEGSKIIEQQAESVKGRKELAATTKTFRKLDDEEKLGQIKGLLKLYQTEIDNLTNRSKFAETCFMKLYKSLAEAPDPTPLLEASVESVASASELARLSAENSRLNDIVSRHADYDTVKGKLLKLEMEHAQTLDARVNSKQAEMEAIFDEKERNWQTREAELVKEIGDLRANQEVAYAQRNNADDDTSVSGSGKRLAELEIVAHDLERANRAAALAEKRNVELRSELESFKSGDKGRQMTQELEGKITDLEGENSILNAKVSSMTSKFQRESAEVTQRLEAIERELQRKTNEAESLKSRLDQQSDYLELKRELEVMKTIEFGDVDDDISLHIADEKDTEEGDQTNQHRSKLESQLLSKNKKMNSELTTMRVANNKMTVELGQLKSELSAAQAQCEQSANLISKLENDLTEMRKSTHSPPMSTVSGWTAWPRNETSPTSSIIDGITGGSVAPSSVVGSSAGLSSLRGGAPSSRSGAGSGSPGLPSGESPQNLLQIVTQQRDRFRARNVELDSELRKNISTINTLRKEIETIKKDNLELYERTRYMQSYEGTKSNSTSAASKYQSLYEEGLSPFQQFRGKETERFLSRLGPFERIVHKFLRTVLSTRLSMNAFVIYCLVIHLIFTVMLFRGPKTSSTANAVVGSSTQVGGDRVAGAIPN